MRIKIQTIFFMKNLFFAIFLIGLSLNTNAANHLNNGEYTLVIEGFDWGAAASKVILAVDDSVSTIDGADFDVYVKRASSCTELSPGEASGQLKIQYAYVSDAKASRIAKGKHLTLVLYTAPFEQLGSPLKYSNSDDCRGNHWLDFELTILNKSTQQIWNKEGDRVIPLIDEFDLSGKFTHKDVTLTYADYQPKSNTKKSPLIIWLHGGGEGGTDPTIPLIANKAANYAAPEMQAYFGGAYVLVPQSPTFWMDNGQGQYTRGEVNDKYNESLMALIEDYVAKHPNIDKDRIYLGGCSNGGYMTIKLLLLRPNYFAAGFPSALAYHAKNLSDAQIDVLKNIPIWFIHSKDDTTTPPNETVVPTYQRLIKAGAKKVHFSYFDHVVDITNQFGGDQFYYYGHLSWIYSHANKCQLDYDGTPVTIDGHPVTLMGWLARQRK